MAATLLAFSYNVLVGIELIGGTPLPRQQQEDYLALWRYIGWLLGVDSTALDPCRDPVRDRIRIFCMTAYFSMLHCCWIGTGQSYARVRSDAPARTR